MSHPTGETQPEAPGGGLPAVICRAAAGLDTGLAGGVAVLVWFAASSLLGGGPWFSRLNLAAAPFYGDSVFASGVGWHSAVGAAHLLLIYSLVGAAYGLLPASREGWLNLMTAIGYAGLIHLCADAWFWKRLHPFAHPYYAPLAVAPGHLIYGLFLWRFPSRLRQITWLVGSGEAIATLASAPESPGIEIMAGPEAGPAPVDTPVERRQDSAVDQSMDLPDGSSEGAKPPSSPDQTVPESSHGVGSKPPSSLE